MTLEEVKELMSAGFTHDEIMSFAQNPQNNTQDANTEHTDTNPSEHTENVQELAPDPVKTSADQQPAQAEKTNIPESKPEFDKLTGAIDKLIKTIQASNLQNNFTGSSGVDIDKQVDNIMKSIIRPEKKGE